MLKKQISIFFSLIYFFLSFVYSDEYVSCKLSGQLGNQLFQVAAAMSLALDNNAVATFPDLNNKECFNIPANKTYIFSGLNTFQPDNKFDEYKEDCFEYTPIPYKANLLLNGYFQSEKYFKHNKDKIVEMFQPSNELLDLMMQKYGDILNHSKTVAIHVRMYHDTTRDYHPFVGWKYFQKAISLFDKDSLFVVFSDNISLCKRKLPKLLETRKVVFIENNFHIYDFYLMSFCKHQIISNSTFSWWGAYLNKNPLKQVVSPSPKNWFGVKYRHLSTKDIIPCEWTIIE